MWEPGRPDVADKVQRQSSRKFSLAQKNSDIFFLYLNIWLDEYHPYYRGQTVSAEVHWLKHRDHDLRFDNRLLDKTPENTSI